MRMRKYLTPALEAEQIAALEAKGNISLEEEQIMLDEAGSDAECATKGLEEADRIGAVSESLEDLAVIADGIEEATPAEVQLVETAGDMAVAGTDIEPEEVVPGTTEEGEPMPALESYIGKKINTEGIKRVATRIWESIKKFLKEIWAKIESFYNNMFGAITPLRKRVEALSKEVAATAGKTSEGKVKISGSVAAVSIDGKPVSSASEIKAGIKDLNEIATCVFDGYVDHVVSVGEKAAKVIGAFTAEKSKETVTELVNACKGFSPKLPGATSAGNRFPGFETHLSKPFLGNKSLATKAYDVKTLSEGSLGVLERVMQSRFEVVDTKDSAAAGPADFELTVMSQNEMVEVCKDLLKTIDILEKFDRGSKRKSLKATQKSIEEATGKATTELGKAKEGVDAATTAEFRKIADFNKTYTHWATKPAVPFLKHAATSVKAIMVLVQKSAAAYK